MMYGLIIKSPFIERILSGEKTWEIRGFSTRIRGRICLIKSGTKTIVGICKLVYVIGPLTKEQFIASYVFHRDNLTNISQNSLPYKKTYAWVLECVKSLKKPIPYTHPRGAITWVKLQNIESKLEVKNFV